MNSTASGSEAYLAAFALRVSEVYLLICLFSLVYDKIRPQYAHEHMYDGMTRKIPSKDTIVLLLEEKANSCQRDSECWRVPGTCTCIVTDDGVTSMMNAF